MENIRKMNVLVLGNSGAGKSTLIEAISGIEIKTGVGEGQTQKIDVYESTTWPICCIDTKGFEYSVLEQLKTRWQIVKFTKEQINANESESNKNLGIDAVWYCIEGTARRTFTYNIEMMNKSIRRWKNVPVFVAITKSYSEADIEENINAVASAFAKSKSINLQKIIPVVAKPYPINDDIVVEPRGIDDLCNATLDCYEEAVRISDENRKRMILEQKRFTANALVAGASAAGVAVGAAPISFADSAILTPLEIGLTKGVFKVYGVDFSGELVTAVVGSTAITKVAKTAVSSLKAIPNIAGSVVNAVVAGFFVAALGESVVALSEAMYLGKVDQTKIDGVVEFITDKLSNNPILGTVTKYFEEHSDQLKGKSAIEIFNTIGKSFSSKKITLHMYLRE